MAHRASASSRGFYLLPPISFWRYPAPMKTLKALIVAFALLGTTFTGTLYAQDITGDWQGTIRIAKDLRTIVRISRQLDGSLQVRVLAIDHAPPEWGSGNLGSAVSLEGADLKFTIDPLKASYAGKLSADGTTITGTLTRDESVPFELSRATSET